MKLLKDIQIPDNPKKRLNDVLSPFGACNFYRRHNHNLTFSSGPLTDLIKKANRSGWTGKEEACFPQLQKKMSSTHCLAVSRPHGKIILNEDACDVGGVSTLYRLQELYPAELTHCQYDTLGLNHHGTLKHDYPANEWRLVPLGQWNWKCNQARSKYISYDQEMPPGMLMLCSQSCLLGSNPIVWRCDQEPGKPFQKGPRLEKAKVK